jgi:hypothetical protein
VAAGTAVPSPTFGPNGFQAPLESAINVGTAEDIQTAFGQATALNPNGITLNPSPATPQGQLAASLAAIIGSLVNNLFLQYTNWVDPALSQGRMQDSIGRIYFIERIASSQTVAQCVCSGNNVTIPQGALAQGNDGNVYICQETGTIPLNGSPITLPFACQTFGPIICAANNIQTIYQAVPGWDSIDNPSAGVTGIATETAQQFEARRGLSVAHNSQGWLAAVIGAVLTVPGVLDAYATENDAPTTEVIGGVSLLPYSIYIAVVGGTAAAIAQAIFTTKSPGSLYNGNTSVTVYDQNPLYSPPYPSYQVSFEIPASLPFLINVTMASNSLVPSNATVLIQTAIINAFAGSDGGLRPSIGSTVYASRFYAGIAAAWTGATIIEILLGTPNNPSASFTGSVSGTTLTVSAVASGAVAVGQTLFDTSGNLIPGTTILSGSGTTWMLSASQTVASEAMTGVVASAFSEIVKINQSPTVTAANIVVTYD